MYIPKEMRDIGPIPPLFPLTNMTSNTHTPSPCAPREKKKINTHPRFDFTRLPLFQGAYGGYIIPLLTLLEVDPNKCKIRPSLQGTGKYMRGRVRRSIKSVKVIISMHRPMYNYT